MAMLRTVAEFFEPDALRLGEAARRIGISEPELRRLISRGEGPAFIKIGGLTLIRQVTIEAWLAEQEAASLKTLRANRALVKKFDRSKPTTPSSLKGKTNDS
jgi:excisionase family DNA binding protein